MLLHWQSTVSPVHVHYYLTMQYSYRYIIDSWHEYKFQNCFFHIQSSIYKLLAFLSLKFAKLKLFVLVLHVSHVILIETRTTRSMVTSTFWVSKIRTEESESYDILVIYWTIWCILLSFSKDSYIFVYIN